MAVRQALPREEELRILAAKYEMSAEEAEGYLSSGVRFADVDKAALYAKIAGREVSYVLSLRREAPWGRVALFLGLTAERLAEGTARHRAACLARWWGFDEARSLAALRAGWPLHWVKAAWIIERYSTLSMETVLAGRPRSTSWWDWAEAHADIPADRMRSLVKEYRNPGLPKKE